MDETERYQRIVNHPQDDEYVLQPPAELLDFAETLGRDPRIPNKAIGRHITTLWRTSFEAKRQHDRNTTASLAATAPERETMARPQHYPTWWGIGAIPFPSDVNNRWMMDFNTTVCYTSLSVPRPFDPHIHGTMSPPVPGFGFNYLGGSPWPGRFDITARRGGGPRGGFAFTTGPTEGNYPTTVLPSPTFDLGRLGYTNGGWNPEGLQYNQRPKTMRLSGLRNGWPHKVFFARSRQVMFRNVYGQISTDEATPRAPTVVLNGSTPVTGVLSVSITQDFNSPRISEISISNVAGRRSGMFRVGDTVQVYAAPRTWANPPLVFTGFIRDVKETSTEIIVTSPDSLGYLGLEPVSENPTFFQSDASAVIRDIVANSSYKPPLGRITANTNVFLPSGMKFAGKTRLASVQLVLGVINETPNLFRINADAQGRIQLMRLPDLDDPDLQPFVAGRMPRTSTPQDFYPTKVERVEGQSDFYNVVTITNDDETIKVQVPALGAADYPARPVHRIIKEKAVATADQARLIGRQLLAQQGREKTKWTIEALPERFDIQTGDIVEFASSDGGLAGRHMVFNISWSLSPAGSSLSMTVGRPEISLLASIRYANSLSI